MRRLKHHEQKLLRKTNFLEYKNENNLHEIKVNRRYHLQDREDYTRYNKIAGYITSLIAKLKQLEANDSTRIKITEQLLERLFTMGLINNKQNLVPCEAIPVSAFCRRRLAVMLTQLKFTETHREAVTFIEQGHIRIGLNVITDPAHHVNRNQEEQITWTDNSKIKKKIMQYQDKLDDYDMLE